MLFVDPRGNLPRRTIAWVAIEESFNSSQASIRAIARAHAVTEGAIRKRAKLSGWARSPPQLPTVEECAPRLARRAVPVKAVRPAEIFCKCGESVPVKSRGPLPKFCVSCRPTESGARKDRACDHCGVSFLPVVGRPRHCSDSCRRDGRKPTVRKASSNRRVSPLKDCACKVCGTAYQAVMARSGFCSKKCAASFYYSKTAYSLTCVECGAGYKATCNRGKCCSEACVKARLSRLATQQQIINPTPRKWANRSDAERYYGFKRRAVIGATDADLIDSEIVFERDGWLCQLCGEEIDRDLVCPNPRAASLDHKIPISRGGRHTYDNVQCAHFGCNSRKGNRLQCEAVS